MTIISPQTFLLLSLARLKGVGPAALKKVAAIPGFENQSLESLSDAVPQVARSLDSGGDWNEAQEWAYAQTRDAEHHEARIISPLDPEYPVLLARTKDDPFILFVKGRLAESGQRSVAIIGTRAPTRRGSVVAQRITTQFGLAGWSIVSGLALGCDSLAHQAAVDCGAHTVAVLAHGLHIVAPSKNKRLSEEIIASGGGLVSEYPFGQGVQSQQYVKRDRTQAGMALGVVMIQSDIKGGSLYASRASLEYGRWLAVPYPTERDLENRESKVQANVIIADAPLPERAALLRCPISALSRVIILRNKEDNEILSRSDGVGPFENMAARGNGGGLTEPVFDADNNNLAINASGSIIADSDYNLGWATSPHRRTEFSSGSHLFDEDASSGKETAQAVLHEAESFSDSAAGGGSSSYGSVAISETLNVSATKNFQEVGTEDGSSYFLSLVLPVNDQPESSFGLWIPPQFNAKELKARLGSFVGDLGLREFYSRHKRLQSCLAKLHRKILKSRMPYSESMLLELRLDSEEIVFHLASVAKGSSNIAAVAAKLRHRDLTEDWIQRNYAEEKSENFEFSGVDENRSAIVDELNSLLCSRLESIVTEEVHFESFQQNSREGVRGLALFNMVECLNKIIIEDFERLFPMKL